jgi:hypothetical protein
VVLVSRVADWGLVLYASHIAQNALREGARKQAVNPKAEAAAYADGKAWAQNQLKIGASFKCDCGLYAHRQASLWR